MQGYLTQDSTSTGRSAFKGSVSPRGVMSVVALEPFDGAFAAPCFRVWGFRIARVFDSELQGHIIQDYKVLRFRITRVYDSRLQGCITHDYKGV